MKTTSVEPINGNRQKLQILNRDVIKYIAMFTMLLNHIAFVFLEEGTILKEVFGYVGYFTAITMCYFLVEGYEYTRSKKKYGLRLLLFAIISEGPFMLAFYDFFHMFALNMIYTLLMCFLILVAREKIRNKVILGIVSVFLVLMTAISDWQFFAAIFTIMFDRSKNSRGKIMVSYGIAFLLFGAINTSNYAMEHECSAGTALLHGALSAVAILVSGIVILFFYNGQRAEHGRKFSKWFFYLFYPGHLLIIGLIHHFVI